MGVQVIQGQAALERPQKAASISFLPHQPQKIEIISILKAVSQKNQREKAAMSIVCDLVASR